ncbi:cupin domain-containing protein [Burkholderia cenocepacia]
MVSDEIWYYHAGDPLTMHFIDEKVHMGQFVSALTSNMARYSRL